MEVERFTKGKGYVATVHHRNMKRCVELLSGIIRVETEPDVIEADKNIDNEASLANEIWNKLRPILNSITDTVKKFLENMCGVQ